MNSSIISIIDDLQSGLEHLVFDIGQGKDHIVLHGEALSLLVKTAGLKKDIKEMKDPVPQRAIESAIKKNSGNINADEINKVARKLPKWANNPHQINSKILSLFLYLQQMNPMGITEAHLKSSYGNDSEFDRNFPQMKSISPKNHGKVFEIINRFVEIWEPVRSIVNDYENKAIKVNFERDLEYVHDACKIIFGHEGRGFGQSSMPFLKGVSDGSNGVQWNLVVDGNDGGTRLGVNLEGMKYDDWPIARFIENELSNPVSGLLSLAGDYSNGADILVCLERDAWQITARPAIREKIIGGRYEPLVELTPKQWEEMLKEAYACLDDGKKHRSRATQLVTLQSNGEKRTMEVSPHLTITTSIWGIGPPSLDLAIEAIRAKMKYMQAIYDHVTNSAR